ncbi:MEDS domain-containing protein [Actinomadura rugatobispora]|uniref:MEDS domain-containing protein n=1 Tax=Actinomadura rugatobispora TaxID=1994 RepID=A0ABW1A6Q1_9ACTN|nr:hypothetical protein GCM10010200_029200 [Actinomadura rugatobispora]
METLWSVRKPGRPVCKVGGLRPGDHGWLAYAGEAERHHVTGAFVRAGLAAGDAVLYLAGSAPVTVPGLPPGNGPVAGAERLHVVALDRAAGRPGAAAYPDVLLRTIAGELARAGGRGLRIAADLTWALHLPDGLERLLRCERDIDLLIGSGGATAVCQFDRLRCAPAELDALGAAHGIAVAPDPEFEDPVLRVVRTFQPPGLAFSGELDASRHSVLVQALATVMKSAGDEEVHLDLGGLGFIDLGSLNILARTAGHPGNRAPLVLDHLSPQLRTLMETVGWHMLPGLRLGT